MAFENKLLWISALTVSITYGLMWLEIEHMVALPYDLGAYLVFGAGTCVGFVILAVSEILFRAHARQTSILSRVLGGFGITCIALALVYAILLADILLNDQSADPSSGGAIGIFVLFFGTMLSPVLFAISFVFVVLARFVD